MGKTTITRMTCDGKGCGKILEKESDGVFLRGHILTAGEPTTLAIEPTLAGNSYCWACFFRFFSDAAREEAHRVTMPKTAPFRPLPRRPEYENTYHGEDGYDPYPRGGHKAPTGPLPPPELPIDAPHYVRIAANISGVGK